MDSPPHTPVVNTGGPDPWTVAPDGVGKEGIVSGVHHTPEAGSARADAGKSFREGIVSGGVAVTPEAGETIPSFRPAAANAERPRADARPADSGEGREGGCSPEGFSPEDEAVLAELAAVDPDSPGWDSLGWAADFRAGRA